MALDFKASNYCVFCRNTLPTLQGSRMPGKTTWEHSVLVLCNIYCTNGSFGIFTKPANLRDPDAISELPIINLSSQMPSTLHISIADADEVFEINRIAYIIHLDCWKIVNKLSAHQLSSSSTYAFAQSTCPLFDIKGAKESQLRHLSLIASVPAAQGKQTDVGELLNRLSKLPTEIQLAISAYCSQTLVQSLVTAGESCKLIGFMNQENLGLHIVNLDYTVETISFCSISLFGKRYISFLQFNSGQKEGKSVLRVKKLGVKGIRFAVDFYGLRAISILYANDSTSSWLGDESNTWKGVVYGNNLESLQITKDALKYLRIDFANNKENPRHPVMWDKDLNSLGTHRILDTVDQRPRIREFPGWRLCRSLSLIEDGKSVSGLTVYCYHHGITGMITHGNSTTLIGTRKGCPIHLHLCSDEHISSVWVRTPGDTFDIMSEPTMLVTTTYNRCRLFGPYLSPDVTQARQYGWTNLCDPSKPNITGLFYDAFSLSPLCQITSIGITGVVGNIPRPFRGRLPRILAPRSSPALPGTISTGLFLSIARLCNVRRLEVGKVGRRCTGMCINYSDNTLEVLGQWDPSQFSEIIYTEQSGDLESLTFYFSGATSSSNVESIAVNDRQTSSAHTQTFLMNQILAWWFTERYDHVSVWDGTSKEITLLTPQHEIADIG